MNKALPEDSTMVYPPMIGLYSICTTWPSFTLNFPPEIVKHTILIVTVMAETNIWFNLGLETRKPGPEVIKLFPCSTQLSKKFILLINVKMPTIVGILTFISMINTPSERFKAKTLLHLSVF